MENIGDWLYIIILIIAGISSVISSARKKARQASEQSMPREIITDNTFDDDNDPWDYQTTEEPAPFIQPQTKQVHRSAPKQSKYNFNKSQEGQSAIVRNDTDSLFTHAEEVHVPIAIEDLSENTEEWRKAFIYSEIFTRKH